MDLVEKLQAKIKTYKRQVEEAVIRKSAIFSWISTFHECSGITGSQQFDQIPSTATRVGRRWRTSRCCRKLIDQNESQNSHQWIGRSCSWPSPLGNTPCSLFIGFIPFNSEVTLFTGFCRWCDAQCKPCSSHSSNSHLGRRIDLQFFIPSLF